MKTTKGARPSAPASTAHCWQGYTRAEELADRIRCLAATRLRRGPLIGQAATVCVVVNADRISVVIDALSESEELDLLASIASRPDAARLVHEALALAEEGGSK